MNVSVRIEDSEVRAFLARARHLAGPLMDQLAATFVRRAADKIIADAANDAPVGEGTLQRSARADVRRRGRTRIEVEFTFGGGAAKYAEVQHENEGLTHTEAAFRARFGDSIIIGFGRRGRLVSREEALAMLAKPHTWASHDTDGTLLGHRNPQGRAHWLYGTPTSAVERNMDWFGRSIATGVERIVRGWAGA